MFNPELADRIASEVQWGSEGGTFATDGRDLPEHGYYVGGAETSLIFDSPDDVSSDKILEFLDRAGTPFVGYWVDEETGKIYIDAVDWRYSEFTAAKLGRERGELAVWDILGERERRLS